MTQKSNDSRQPPVPPSQKISMDEGREDCGVDLLQG